MWKLIAASTDDEEHVVLDFTCGNEYMGAVFDYNLRLKKCISYDDGGVVPDDFVQFATNFQDWEGAFYLARNRAIDSLLAKLDAISRQLRQVSKRDYASVVEKDMLYVVTYQMLKGIV